MKYILLIILWVSSSIVRSQSNVEALTNKLDTARLAVFAQTIHGTTYYKISNEPFPFVSVDLIDSESGKVLRTVETDLDGNFKFEDVAKGRYTIKTFETTYGDSTFSIVVDQDLTLKIVILNKNCIYNKSLKDKTCPICHKKDKTIPIVYGLVIDSGNKKRKKKNYLNGGCKITNCDPNWFCERDKIKF